MSEQTVPGAPSPIPALPNLRDLGGWVGDGGRAVRSGRLYRSTDFRTVPIDHQKVLGALELRTIYDLRSAAERSATPDPVLPGVDDIFLDVLADDKTAIPGNLNQVLSDPKIIHEMQERFGGGGFDAAKFIVETYRGLVSMPSALSAYRRFYQGLLGADENPALFHCTTGKDRTGWAAASFLTLMGVEKDAVYRDYLLTNERLLPALQPLFDGFAANGGDPELLKPVLGVRAEYLDAAFDEVATKFGGFTGYLEKGLQLDTAAQQQLRDRFLIG